MMLDDFTQRQTDYAAHVALAVAVNDSLPEGYSYTVDYYDKLNDSVWRGKLTHTESGYAWTVSDARSDVDTVLTGLQGAVARRAVAVALAAAVNTAIAPLTLTLGGYVEGVLSDGTTKMFVDNVATLATELGVS
jgi:hypothetical protein